MARAQPTAGPYGDGAQATATQSTDDLPTSSGDEVSNVATQGTAKLLGICATDAAALLAAQGRFGEAVDQIRTRYGEWISAVSWSKPDGIGEVSLVKNAPSDVVAVITDIVSRAGAHLTGGAEMSEAARGEQAVRLAEAILAAHPDLKSLGVHPTKDYSGLIVESPVAVQDAVDAWVRDPTGGAGTSVGTEVQPGRISGATGGVVGGAQLNYPGGSAACTSAFTILIGDSAYLLTAGHCPTQLNYANNPWLGLSFPQHYGDHGDMQYHWIYNGGVGQPKFQYTAGALTYNKHASSVYSGQIVNRYGRNTSETLKVDNPDSTEHYDDGTTLTHVAVTYTETNLIPGDSGGPWWIGASGGAAAVGVTSGKIWTNLPWGECCHRAVFPPATTLNHFWPSASYFT